LLEGPGCCGNASVVHGISCLLLLYACPEEASKSKLPEAREDLNPALGFSQFLSLGFENFAVPIEKVTFFEKKSDALVGRV
jgi:hypothetical protein